MVPTLRLPRIARRSARAVAVLLGTGIALLVLTAQIAPGWRIADDQPPLEPLPENAPEPSMTAVRYPVGQDAIAVRAGGTVLRGWLVRPLSIGAATPGVVLVPGAGTATRDGLLAEARVLASSGVAALVYEKRADGYSPTTRDYAALADDAIAAGEVLAAASGVDASRIGVMGVSEGGWVAPLAVQRAPARFSFLVLASAPVVTPLEQVAWATDQAIATAPSWVRRIPATALAAGRPFVDYLDFDVRPALRSIDVPVHAVWGADDATLPVAVAVRRVRDAVSAPVSARILPAGHSLAAGSGWLAEAADWMTALPAGEGDVDVDVDVDVGEIDTVRGVEPPTLGLARLPDSSWVTSPVIHLAFSAALAAASVLLPLRVSKGTPWPPVN